MENLGASSASRAGARRTRTRAGRSQKGKPRRDTATIRLTMIAQMCIRFSDLIQVRSWRPRAPGSTYISSTMTTTATRQKITGRTLFPGGNRSYLPFQSILTCDYSGSRAYAQSKLAQICSPPRKARKRSSTLRSRKSTTDSPAGGNCVERETPTG